MYPSLTRYPGDVFATFDALSRTMDQLFGVGAPSSIRAATRGAFPALNMGTTENALEIYALRVEAERALGPRFDLTAFHDRVLANGAITLPMLRESITRWIAEARGQ